jgi:hypothetical protein
VTNVVGFFLTGLPGGMDYFMLVLVKLGKMDRLTEKRYNTRIMTWLRGPGALSASFMLYIICLDPSNRSDYRHWYTPWAVLLVAFLCFVNSQFYLLQVSFVLLNIYMCVYINFGAQFFLKKFSLIRISLRSQLPEKMKLIVVRKNNKIYSMFENKKTVLLLLFNCVDLATHKESFE